MSDKVTDFVNQANEDNQEHPCITCQHLYTRQPDHMSFISAQYVATALYKECVKPDHDADKILKLAQATAILIKES